MKYPGFSIYLSLGKPEGGIGVFEVTKRYVRIGFVFFAIWIALIDLDTMMSYLLHSWEAKDGRNM